jgi:SAM-dependent methyltransferase
MRACPVCQNTVGLRTLWGIDNLVHCPHCGLGYADTLPTVAELEQIYSAEYFHGFTDYKNYVGDKTALRANFQHYIRIIQKYCNQGDLFEAGAAYGFFLELAQQYWNVQGIDISQDAVAYARDVLHLSVSQGDLESHPPASNAFDIIVMFDTIEHLYDPAGAILKCAAALRDGGYFALTTGDIDGLLPRLQKQSWRMIHRAHLYYFSRKSITYLLQHAGFEVIHFSHHAFYRSVRQLAQVISFYNPNSTFRRAIVKAIETIPGSSLKVPLNTYDLMFVIARKKL